MDNQPNKKLHGNLASLESQSLETHVVVSHERHEEIQKRFDKVDLRMDKMEEHTDRQFTKIERIIIWSMGTLFITLLTTLFTIVYRAG
jgi:tetrahydromethanopterin S-methyltransferase subunit G